MTERIVEYIELVVPIPDDDWKVLRDVARRQGITVTALVLHTVQQADFRSGRWHGHVFFSDTDIAYMEGLRQGIATTADGKSGKVSAIKRCREISGWGLVDCKAFVESI